MKNNYAIGDAASIRIVAKAFSGSSSSAISPPSSTQIVLALLRFCSTSTNVSSLLKNAVSPLQKKSCSSVSFWNRV